MNIRILSDTQLYNLCRRYGEAARFWRQRFMGLLPEVYRRHLYTKEGFSSVFEFAKKLAGLSEEQVRRVLNISTHFHNKPHLNSLLENGAVSINKLARVVSVATPENEEELAEKVRLLPQKALEMLVREERDDMALPLNGAMKNYGAGYSAGQQEELPLSPEIKNRLLVLHKKGININSLLNELLDEHEQKIQKEKNMLAQKAEAQENATRAVPAAIKNVLKKEYGTKCSIPNCTQEATTIHHTQRFALGKNHNPYFLAPLCKEHHTIAHLIDVKFAGMRANLSSVSSP